MIICSRSPVRIDFLGAGSDAPPFSTEHGGTVINGGINRYATCRLELDSELEGVEIVSRDLDETVRAESVENLSFDGRLDLLKAAVRRSGVRGPMRLTTQSDVPPQSGLGASASVAIAVLAACLRGAGRPIDHQTLYREARAAEREDLGIAGGGQDQLGAIHGRIHAFHFRDPKITIEPMELTPEQVAALEDRLLLVYTGVTHLSGHIHDDIRRDYLDDTSPCKQAMFNLARLAREGIEILQRGDLNRFGRMLNDNWRYHKDLHSSCSNEHLDEIYAVAARHGMLGGKTCGAGGGGCVVFYCADGRRAELMSAVERLGCSELPFRFDPYGALAWEVEP